MRIHAYVLAADPTWLVTSITAYYEHVERLVVAYDEQGRGWTGAPVDADRCLSAVAALDVDSKVELLPGSFGPAETAGAPIESETLQRRQALTAASPGADWVLQLDTDEVLPHWQPLRDAIELAEQRGLDAVEWPMRVLYRRLRSGKLLEVVHADGSLHFEYPGAVAVRAGTDLLTARRTQGAFLRPTVAGDVASLQVARRQQPGEHRELVVPAAAAIWHNSWARPPRAVRTKIASWGHNQGLRSWAYYYRRWLPTPILWKRMHDLHPLDPPLWPRLRVAPPLPFAVSPLDADIP